MLKTHKKIRNGKGFTLVEVQVAIILLLFAMSGMGLLVMNDLKQLQWLEQRKQLYSFIPPDKIAVLFTEITSNQNSSGTVNKIDVDEIKTQTSSLKATIKITDK